MNNHKHHLEIDPLLFHLPHIFLAQQIIDKINDELHDELNYKN